MFALSFVCAAVYEPCSWHKNEPLLFWKAVLPSPYPLPNLHISFLLPPLPLSNLSPQFLLHCTVTHYTVTHSHTVGQGSEDSPAPCAPQCDFALCQLTLVPTISGMFENHCGLGTISSSPYRQVCTSFSSLHVSHSVISIPAGFAPPKWPQATLQVM